jgi:NAD(P)-dependent dehydrogenase (short-subunit alcohol dehydrogenase family)
MKRAMTVEEMMQGKTIVITGATSGIGEVAAIRLAEQGARIVHVARDPVRAEATQTALKKANPAADHVVHIADLSRLAEMKRVAGVIAAAEPRIDVLIDNAGALFTARHETADGLELTFALNHMGYFVVTNLLLPNIVDGGRIVAVASGAHRGAKLNLDDLQLRKNFGGWRAYANSKLCNILFTRALARRCPRGITANCLHPGFVATRFADQSGGWTQRFAGFLKRLSAITPEEGARTIIYLASSPEVAGVSGQYFFECKPATPTSAGQNDEDAERLWRISQEIAAI